MRIAKLLWCIFSLPFHGGDTGSTPVRDAKSFQALADVDCAYMIAFMRPAYRLYHALFLLDDM